MRLRPAVFAVAALAGALTLVPSAVAGHKSHHRMPKAHGMAQAPVPSAAGANAIPGHIGRQGSASFRVNPAVPAGVDPARFAELAASAGARWGLRATGESAAQPLVADRVNTVGFSAEAGPNALGVQRDVVQTVRQRGSGRVLRTVVIDQDLALATDVAWQQGPAHPSPQQFDLETVLIHELGHMAGNKDHAPLCSNSPLVPSAAPGEWWRSPDDYLWGGCGAAARSVGPVAEAPIRHEVVRITRWVG